MRVIDSMLTKRRTQKLLTGSTVEHRRMPTILGTGPYKFYFYSHEMNEPPHVHVDRDSLSVKFWLKTAQLARNIGFSPRELNSWKLLFRKIKTN